MILAGASDNAQNKISFKVERSADLNPISNVPPKELKIRFADVSYEDEGK